MSAGDATPVPCFCGCKTEIAAFCEMKSFKQVGCSATQQDASMSAGDAMLASCFCSCRTEMTAF
eukprot:11060647-Karenia_brevis.AAC.1